MFIANFMTTPARTITPDTLLPEARALMSQGHFRHLPVVDGEGHLIGIVTDRDLRSALPTGLMDEQNHQDFLKRFETMPIKAVMTEATANLPAEATLDDALLLFDRTKVGGLPVVDCERKVVGILSVRDLLTAYRQLFGLDGKGSALVGVVDDGKPGVLTRLCEVLETNQIPFTRLLRTNQNDQGKGLIYVRVHTFNISGVHQTLAAAGFVPATPAITRKEKDA
ncbi:MAG: CBS domain-containing protein [Proteobacteria bacterium]|nr:CBS domain-containing protein [Pseudomonadota bacterium]MBU1687362.1 CBS domain-containing protein [Pseudomonadota bacterium]